MDVNSAQVGCGCGEYDRWVFSCILVQFEGGPISIGMQDQFSAPRLRDAIGPDYLSLGNRK
jgi:hypothetical protein